MIEFNKKQVKGLIDIMKSKDGYREALESIRIRRDGYAYCTDGYVMVRWEIETEAIPSDDEQEDICIPRELVERWYKLAKARDTLTELDLIGQDMCAKDYVPRYPDVEQLWEQYNTQEVECKNVMVDVEKLAMVSKVIGDNCVNMVPMKDDYDRYVLKVMAVEGSEVEAIVMPLADKGGH